MKIYIVLPLQWEDSIGAHSGSWEINEAAVKVFREKTQAIKYGDEYIDKNKNDAMNIIERTLED